jgi:hypothetical protein
MAPWNFCRKLEREKNEALAMLQRIARKNEFMDMEGQRLVVSDWLARRHIIPENAKICRRVSGRHHRSVCKVDTTASA